MRDRSSLSTAALVAFLAVSAAGGAMMPSAATAQGLIFDWDGEKTADSGKSHIKFSGGGKPGEIIVSFADRKLYFFTAPGEADVYPVATPRDQSRWEGVTSVSQKRENPSWTPTAHMLSENPKLPRWVPGGHPMNPLGIRALYLGASDYRIHGTDAPWTIGTPVSKGCVRMFNKDVVDLYPRVKVGTKVTVTWQKFDGKTMSIAETKGITELPANAPLPPDGKAAKPTLALATGNEAVAASPKSKWRKSAADDAEDATLPMAEKPKVAAEKAATEDDGVVKKRKWSKAKPVDGDEAGNDVKVVSKSEGKVEAKAEIKAEGKVEPVKASADAEVATEPKREKRVRTASHTKSQVKSDAGVETGSLPKKTDDSASLGVAEKALAAAERAAAAAERAAAAAERAVAASQMKAAVETPAVAVPAGAPAANAQ